MLFVIKYIHDRDYVICNKICSWLWIYTTRVNNMYNLPRFSDMNKDLVMLNRVYGDRQSSRSIIII